MIHPRVDMPSNGFLIGPVREVCASILLAFSAPATSDFLTTAFCPRLMNKRRVGDILPIADEQQRTINVASLSSETP